MNGLHTLTSVYYLIKSFTPLYHEKNRRFYPISAFQPPPLRYTATQRRRSAVGRQSDHYTISNPLYASLKGKHDTVQFLIKNYYYQDVNIKTIKDNDGRDAILSASYGGREHTIDLLHDQFNMIPTSQAYKRAKKEDTMNHLKEKYGLGYQKKATHTFWSWWWNS